MYPVFSDLSQVHFFCACPALVLDEQNNLATQLPRADMMCSKNTFWQISEPVIH